LLSQAIIITESNLVITSNYPAQFTIFKKCKETLIKNIQNIFVLK